MNLFTIPPGIPFLDTIATWWLTRTPNPNPLETADGLILLPTRRAARALTEAFLRAANGRPLLLPRIAAIGALDEAPLSLAGVLDLPAAIPEPERLAQLTRLVMALKGQYGAPQSADRAWLLAAELARLLDEAHREGVALERTLPTLVDENYAEHWTDTLEFLKIVTATWPTHLAETNRIDTTDRAVRLLDIQAEAWTQTPPKHPVIIAGLPGGIAAMARLMRVVARLPNGTVILPGLDHDMPDEFWNDLQDSHPQSGLRALLSEIQATRADVQPWPGTTPPPRAALIWRTLLPAKALVQWRTQTTPDITGLERLQTADQQEEATAIALILREALETPGAQAALVTPDRTLAARVAAELARFAVTVDDSAGEPLAETPPGTFLRLLVQAVAESLAPVALLGLLKHPLAALGLPPATCRQRARRLERAILRGPAPPPGIPGLRAALTSRPIKDLPDLTDLVDRLETRLKPLLTLTTTPNTPPAQALRALIEAAEATAETDQHPGPARLWALEEGEALAEHLAGLLTALPLLPPQPIATLPGLLDATLQGATVRSRRALRGREGDEHPRIAILGLLEARLQSFDLLILGSLTEAVWPPAADPGPWMSRPMRRAAKLASPEAAIGQMAHDFALLTCAAPRIILSCPRRRDGAPTVPARWLVRLEAFLEGQGTALPRSPAAAWARQLDQPASGPRPVHPPRPTPPLAARPRRLSVTEIETWLRDPYGLYAKHILHLRALDDLEQSVEDADFGNLVHAAIAAWVTALPHTYPHDAAARLEAAFEAALAPRPIRAALAAWWRPRLARIAAWVAEQERTRRLASPNTIITVEQPGTWFLPNITPPFELRARADRIERMPNGALALLDYKTGTVPTGKAVEAGYAPQLPLEAAMAANGAFGPTLIGTAAELAYWRLTGGYVPGEAKHLFKNDPTRVAEAATEAARQLTALIQQFDNPAQPYLSQPNPGDAPRYTDYAQLARVAEWSAVEDDTP